MSTESDVLTRFVRDMVGEETGLLGEMAKDAVRRNIPICHPETAALLKVLVTLKKPLRILEAGTAVGFSAAVMSLCQPENGILDTMELSLEMADEAEENLRKLSLSNQVRVLRGDALDTMQCLTTPYDMIFLDAAKGQYLAYLAEALRLLAPEGMIVADNVLYKGLVALDNVPHKHRTIHDRLRIFLTDLMSRREFETSLLNVGDGIAIAVRKKE